MTLRTPPGTWNLLFVMVVPTIRFRLSGCYWSFRRRATKCCPKNVLRLEIKNFMGWYCGRTLTTGFSSSVISCKYLKCKYLKWRKLNLNYDYQFSSASIIPEILFTKLWWYDYASPNIYFTLIMTWTRLFYVKNLELAFKRVIPGRERKELQISKRYQA